MSPASSARSGYSHAHRRRPVRGTHERAPRTHRRATAKARCRAHIASRESDCRCIGLAPLHPRCARRRAHAGESLMSSTTINVSTKLASRTFAGVPLSVALGTFVIMVLDGFDLQLIGFAAPALIAELG